MKKIIALLLALVMVISITACAPAKPEETKGTTPNTPTSGTEDTKGTEGTVAPSEIETPLVIQWDQAYGTDMFEAPYIDDSLSYHSSMMWEPLWELDTAVYNETGEVIFKLASGWTYNEDNTVITVTVRDNAVWSDGEPITAEDVAFTFMAAIKDPSSAYAGHFTYVKGYDAFVAGETDTLEGLIVDGQTLTMELSQPGWFGYVPRVRILPAHCFEGVAYDKVSNHEAYWKAPVTSGPFKFVEASFPDYAKLTRFDEYYGAKAGIKNVTCVSFEAATTDAAIASMISGESHITTRTVTSSGLLAGQIVAANPDCKPMAMHSNSIRSFTFNMGTRTDGKDKAALIGQDAKARQAISLIIDEETIGAYLASPACTVFAPPSSAAVENKFADTHKAKDLEKAKQLLDEAGWNYDDTIDIMTFYQDQGTADILEIIKNDAEQIGVKVNINVISADVAEAAIYEDRNFDMLFFMLTGSDTAPSSPVIEELHSAGPVYYGHDKEENKWMGEKYDPLREVLYTATSATDPEYVAAVQDIADYIYEDCVIIPVYVNATVIVYNQAVLYIPDTEFDYFDSVFHYDQWKLLK